MAFGQFGGGGGVSTSAFKVPTGRPKSIIAQALAGHPNWRGTPPPSVGSAGSSLLSGLTGGLSHVPNTTQPAPPTAPPAPTPPAGSPLDAQYYANIAANQFQVGNQINALNAKDSNNLTTLQSTLGNLAYQQPRDQLALEQKANAGGGLYSSVEDQNQSNLARAYLGKQTAAQTAYDQAHSALASQIAGLLGGEQNYETQQAIDAANRAAAQAQANPALGAPAPAAASASPGASSAGGGGGAGGRGGSPRSQVQEARAQQRAQQAQSSAQRLAQSLAKRRGR